MRNHILRQIGAVGLCLGLLGGCGIQTPTKSVLSDTPSWASGFKIESRQEIPIGINRSTRLTSVISDANGIEMPYQGKVEWRITSGDAATIEANGLVNGIKEGKVIVEAIAPEVGFKSTLEVEVVDKPIEIYLHAPDNWDSANIWFWYLAGDPQPSGKDKNGNALPIVQPSNIGQFPGPQMQPVDGFPGWFKYSIPSIRSSELARFNLKEQPVRLLFSNPARGEKTRDMQHFDGCFLRYNKYLGDPSNLVIDGRWDSPNNCRPLKKKRRLVAKPAGGPVWDRTFVDVDLSYGKLEEVRYVVSDKPVDASQGTLLADDVRTIEIGPQFFRNSDELTLCVNAKDEIGETYNRCYPYYLEKDTVLNELGADYSPEATRFAIWSPDRFDVQLWLDGKLIPAGYSGDALDMPGLRSVVVPGDHLGKPYQFILDGVVVRDPYGKMVIPGTDYNVVVEPDDIEPIGGWAPLPELVTPEDAIVYELSIRDFTFDPSSGVSPELRGKFLGAVERGTYLNKGSAGADPSIKTGIDHLIEMGVTHVQLMPIYDSATCSPKDALFGPGCYNWGYDPENWNVPDERFSTQPNNYVEHIRELQTMVNEFHKAGIRVIMDVVYNHTWVRPFRESDEGEKMLGDITGKYFLADPDGFGYQLTGTGNTIDARDPMVAKLIEDSMIYWAKTYGISGFRHDIAGAFEAKQHERWANALNNAFPDRTMVQYGEPWTALADPNPNNLRLYNIGSLRADDGDALAFGGFNFTFREAIKGFNDFAGGGGFAFNQIPDPRVITNGIRGSIGNQGLDLASFATRPSQSINYVSSHDNLTLFDKINLWASIQDFDVSFDYKRRIAGFANSIVLASQGIPLIHSGAEMLRTKNGISDSYKSPDSINRVDWNRKKDFFDVYETLRDMIEVRREFPGFRLDSADEVNRNVRVNYFGDGLFEARIFPNSRSDKELLVYLNSGADRSVILPDGGWKVRFENARSSDRRVVSGSFGVKGTSVTVFYKD